MKQLTYKRCSIIVTTCNRSQSLGATLDSVVEACQIAGRDTELIVVDNASTDDTRQVAEQQTCHGDVDARYVFESRPGQTHARNAGLAVARGEVIVFTDDDIRCGRDWPLGLVHLIEEGRADAVSGGVLLPAHLSRSWLTPKIEQMLAIRVPGRSYDLTLIGANMAFHRRVLKRVPCFDGSLGPGALGFFDDTLWSWQLAMAGYRLVMNLGVQVEHYFDPLRLRRRNLLDTARRAGRSAGFIAHHWRHQSILFARLRRLRCWLQSQALLLARRLPRPSEAEGVLDLELDFQFSMGFFQQYLIERKLPRLYEKHGLARRDYQSQATQAPEAILETIHGKPDAEDALTRT